MSSPQDRGVLPAAMDRAVGSADSPLTPDVDVRAEAASVESGAPEPDLKATARALGGPRGRSIDLTMLTVLAVLYTLYFAREFLIPIVFALLLNVLLSPLIRLMGRWRIPAPASAALVVIALVSGIGGGAYQLAGPAQRWAMTAPQSFTKAQGKLRRII